MKTNTTNATILRQIVELSQKSAADLRKIYNSIMSKECPANANKEYLQPRIAYRLQELTFGSVSEETKNKLLKISSGMSVNSIKHHSDLMIGTKLCREWNGTMYQVEILKDGFEYQGQKFRSLSSIAGKITGTKWNGLKFFKLRS